MTDILWTLVLLQMAMGAFDTLYHHELTERLAWRPGQQHELNLHGVRNLLYAVLFLALGFTEPRGVYAFGLIGLVLVELGITLWDFVEEDRTRLLPPSERVTHTLLTLNYGVILALLVPWLWSLGHLPTALPRVDNGLLGWICAIAAAGVVLSGLRDMEAARRALRLSETPAKELAEALEGKRSVLVTGGTGFVGTRLVAALVAAGHAVTVLSRNADKARDLNAMRGATVVGSFDEIASDTRIDAVVNLAGEPLADGLWTKAKRRRILQSRVDATRDLVAFIRGLEDKPHVLVSGSAVGWYGLRDKEKLAENVAPRDCFSHRVCEAWEREAMRVDDMGVRLVRLRIGLVFGRSGGMLARMLMPFEFFLGGRIGSGKQFMSWIHRDDLVRLILHCIATPAVSGPVNATAPVPVTNAGFTRALAHALRRPVSLPLPAAPLRFALGGFAEELLLGGQRVLPAKALATGFRFEYPSIEPALAQICGPRKTGRIAEEPIRLARLEDGRMLR